MYQSIPAVPIPPRATPGAIAEIFQPGGGDLDIFHHGNWWTEYNMADFAGKDTEFVCKWLDTHSLGWSFSTIVFDH